MAAAWDGDKLDRKKEASYIINYLNAIYEENSQDLTQSSFVLNLNAPWGYGKTYFLENLKLDLEAKSHPVLYFDAWRNDYSKNPLLGFISEINEALQVYKSLIPKGEELVSSFLDQGKKIIGSIAGIGTNILVKKMTGFGLNELGQQFGSESSEVATKIGDQSESVVSKIVQKSLNEHQELKHLIDKLKITLQKLTISLHENANFELPMYILVDELDRCRPTYAIELLENIKHIFNSEGIFFILATNKEQLAHSIKAVYGDSLDSYNYLKRFFSQEYTISVSDRTAFIDYVFTKHRISSLNLIIPFDSKLNNTDKIEQFLFRKLCDGFELGLRDIEQVSIQLKSILLTNKDKKIHYLWLIFILIFRFKNKDEKELKIDSFKGFTVICMTPTDPQQFSYRPTPVDIFGILEFYKSITSMTRTQLQKKYNNSSKQYEEIILQELVKELTDQDGLASISKYTLLAQQAGHIS